jgi:thiol:disulfide interchange protein DsbC
MAQNKTLSLKAVHLVVVVVAVLLTTVSAGRLYAQCTDKTKGKNEVVETTPEKRTAEAVEAFKRDFSNIPFTQIEESGIEGVYEVTSGINIAYYAPASGRVIIGELFDKTGKNITAEKRQKLIALQEMETAKLIDTLPLDKAIRIGSGKNIVVEFTDIDCPYCRKAEAFFKNRDDITRYIFLYPLEQLHPKSLIKSREVLCSKDPAKAYKAAMEGEFDNAELKGCGDRRKVVDQILDQYKTTAGKMGVNGTPTMWVNKKQVNGADTQKIEQYLASNVSATTAQR